MKRILVASPTTADLADPLASSQSTLAAERMMRFSRDEWRLGDLAGAGVQAGISAPVRAAFVGA